jgi:16S rRNA (cytosine967-C5)-methyltransferase
MKIRTARELALECLLLIEQDHLLIPEAMQRCMHQLNSRDRQLANELVYGTFRYLPGLEKVLKSFVPKPRYPKTIHWLLLLGLYQLLFTRIPDYAVLNESNRMCERLKMKGLKALVNGVLRRAGREKESLLANKQTPQWLLPPGLLRLFQKQYGEDTVAQWCQAWSERGTQTYWTPNGQPQEGDQRLDPLPHAIQRQGQLTEEIMTKGQLYVQNESSQAVAELACRLNPESVLDVCGAPGGKACYIATFGKPKQLLVCDASAERLALVAENRERLGLQFEMAALAAEDLDLPAESFDLVLVDAPCSGIGILGRHPEVKYLKQDPATADFRKRQSMLMQRGWSFVKPGGHLLFTVCSLDQDEVPAFPQDAIADTERLADDLLAPHQTRESGMFYIEPSSRYDGFCGALLRKPDA